MILRTLRGYVFQGALPPPCGLPRRIFSRKNS